MLLLKFSREITLMAPGHNMPGKVSFIADKIQNSHFRTEHPFLGVLIAAICPIKGSIGEKRGLNFDGKKRLNGPKTTKT